MKRTPTSVARGVHQKTQVLSRNWNNSGPTGNKEINHAVLQQHGTESGQNLERAWKPAHPQILASSFQPCETQTISGAVPEPLSYRTVRQ